MERWRDKKIKRWRRGDVEIGDVEDVEMWRCADLKMWRLVVGLRFDVDKQTRQPLADECWRRQSQGVGTVRGAHNRSRRTRRIPDFSGVGSWSCANQGAVSR